MNKLVLSIIVCLFLWSTVINFSLQTYGQETTKNIQDVKIQILYGQVLRREERTLSIETKDGIKEVLIPNGVKITRDESEASLQAIRPNDQVKIVQTEKGEILSLDAISGKVVEQTSWIIPSIVGGALFLILLFFAWQRMNRDRIKTTTTKVT